MVWRFLFPKKTKQTESDDIHKMVEKFQKKGLKVKIVEPVTENNPLREIFLNDEYLDLHEVSTNCPECKTSFGKIPTRSAKCKECGNQFLVKKDPFQKDVKYLILKNQFHEKEVYWKPYISYEKTKKWINSVWPNGSPKFVNRDFDWKLLNDWKVQEMRKGATGGIIGVCSHQADFLEKEGKFSHCYETLCELNFIQINQETETAELMGTNRTSLHSGFPPRSTHKKMFKIARKLNYNYDLAKQNFVKRVKNLRGPLSPEEAFEILAEEYGFA